MSRPADLLNDPVKDESAPPQIQIPSHESIAAANAHQPSIVSPLGALAIDSQLNSTRDDEQINHNKGDSTQRMAEQLGHDDKTAGTIDSALASTQNIKNELSMVTENIQIQAQDGPQITTPTIETTLSQIKKEESQGPASIRGASPAVSTSNMPAKGPPKKKSGTGGPRKPPTKKRKLDSRADTPQSHRSGTPNSVLGAKAGPKARKQNSATPLHSSPAPDDDGDEDDESDDGLYCICRKGDDHTWMIACDGGCDDWFHGRCVGIDQRDGNLIDRFICPNCSETKDAETTWKLMCRLEGCRDPAAITGPKPSKYCCDDHATLFFKRLIKKGLGVDPVVSAARKRRKENLTDNFQNQNEEYDKPTHLRGGLLTPGEIKAITTGMTSLKEFRALGNSVPGLNDTKGDDQAMQVDIEPQYTEHEAEQLKSITARTEHLQRQFKSLDNRERFLGLVKTRAKSALEDFKKKDKSMKDMCGFDRRLRLSDDDFDAWCDSADGQEAFKSGKLLADQKDADGDATMTDNAEELGKGMCLRKRCKQHEGWFKLHSQEFAYGKADVTRELSQKAAGEQKIRERATIRQLEARSFGAQSNNAKNDALLV